MKNEFIGVKVEKDVKDKFYAACKQNNTDSSHEIRLFIHRYIDAHKSKNNKVVSRRGAASNYTPKHRRDG